MPNPNSPAGDTDTLSAVITDQGSVDAGTPDANDVAATPSGAAGEKDAKPQELDLEAVVRKAAEDANPDAKATSADGKDGQEDETNVADDADKDTGKEKTPEELAAEQAAADAKLPFHKHPRWQEVLRERDGYKQQIEQLAPKAQQFDQIGAFMREHELTAQEVSQGFEIMALMKHDPQAALERLSPHLGKLELATGRRLPEDLQERVDAGTLTAEDAGEIVRSRMAAATAQVRAERVETREQETRQTQAASAMRGAVEAWEADVKTRDPDYSHKQSFVADRARVLMQQTPPRNPDEAVALAKKAYDEVTASMRRIVGNKPPVRTTTSDKTSTTVVPAPTTLEGIIRGALRQ